VGVDRACSTNIHFFPGFPPERLARRQRVTGDPSLSRGAPDGDERVAEQQPRCRGTGPTSPHGTARHSR
jgi:hypothetical protein